MPWSVWQRNPDAPNDGGEPFLQTHSRFDDGHDLTALFAVSGGITAIATEWFESFGGLVIQNALVNQGFSGTPEPGSTLRADVIDFTLFTGVTFRIPEPGIFFRAQYFYPFRVGTRSALPSLFGGGTFTIGADFGERW